MNYSVIIFFYERYSMKISRFHDTFVNHASVISSYFSGLVYVYFIYLYLFARMTLRLRKISCSYKEIKKMVRKDEVKENYAEMRVAVRR